jgi:hypothetical protein
MVNQSLGVDVLEWYNPFVNARQQKEANGWPTRHNLEYKKLTAKEQDAA